jgi:hypothetical protein
VATALTQAGLPAIAGAELAAGQDGTELTVRLLLKPVPGVGPSEVGQLVQQAAEAIAARLGGRLRRGIAFSAAAPAAPAARPHG